MNIISDTKSLAACAELLRAEPFFAIDTEFLRETTYWPKLCLIQVANAQVEAIIDPLAPGLDLTPLLEVMADPSVIKLFHAARQDMEIFTRLMHGKPPAPIFDSQIAAMACGYGDSIAYDALVAMVLKGKVDKTSRFTDWSRRPLSEDQLGYALGDVTHLRDLYPILLEKLEAKGRTHWLDDETAALTDPALYDTSPETAWERFKPKRFTPDYLACLYATAKWREEQSQAKDVPRGRILKDDVIMEIAEQRPRTVEALGRLRTMPKGWAGGRQGQELAAVISYALANAEALAPKVERPTGNRPPAATLDLLRVLLKACADDAGVAPRLIASASDLEAIADSDDADTPALRGWRLDVFGHQALKLKHGELALAVRDNRVQVFPVTAHPAEA